VTSEAPRGGVTRPHVVHLNRPVTPKSVTSRVLRRHAGQSVPPVLSHRPEVTKTKDPDIDRHVFFLFQNFGDDGVEVGVADEQEDVFFVEQVLVLQVLEAGAYVFVSTKVRELFA